jgi:Ca-activated chloride channel family protein
MHFVKGLVVVAVAAALCGSGGNRVAADGDRCGSIVGTVVSSEDSSGLRYVNVIVPGTNLGAMTVDGGRFEIKGVPPGTYVVKAMMMGYKAVEKSAVVVTAGQATEVHFELDPTIVMKTQEIIVTSERPRVKVTTTGCGIPLACTIPDPQRALRCPRQPWNTESYDVIDENRFLDVIDNPFSTFSIDVDAASYSNVRRYLEGGRMPPADAVRIEELINYFTYEYPDPEGDAPFSITTEVTRCPWTPEHRLVHIGLQGKRIPLEDMPPNNLVFLLDVSGSMQPANKLPLLRRAFVMLTQNLRDEDRIAIVVYAGAAGLVLPSTPGSDKQKILEAINKLQAGGTTAGGAGIKLAYKVAEENFIENGNNRVILATDGDFNTGVSSDAEMVRLIEEKRKSGVFITALGFGFGNLKDSKLEKIADHGNGHYAYIDDIFEARKVLVNELGATLCTIAKDVKIQVEFNPAKVQSYRLIGYENRMLQKEDFEDDRKDAGEIGAGHSVTALYEIVPADERRVAKKDHKTKYMVVSVDPEAFEGEEMLTVRFRYKAPDGDTSREITQTLDYGDVAFDDASDDLRFAAAVAQFGMLLRQSEHKGEASYEGVLRMAKAATGEDNYGYRHEFVRLVEKCRELQDDEK